jgi:O-antigen/teichoic acid export membrane protein
MNANSTKEALMFYSPNIITRLMKSSFTKNVLLVMTGSAGAQAIGFAMSPIISRLYSPADFGVFGSFSAVLSIATSAVTLNYAQAMMLPKQNKDAINLFVLSCASSALIAACCLAVYLFAPDFLQSLVKISNSWLLPLFVVAILISGLNESLQAWCVRAKAFKDTAASQVIRSLSSNGSQVGLGFLRGGPLALICGTILGEMLACLNLAHVVFRDLGVELHREISWSRMRSLAKDYRDFPLYSGPKDIMSALSLGLPVLLLTHFYGIAVAGIYAFGLRILATPMGLVTRSIQQVLFQKASEANNNVGRLFPLYVKTTLGLFALVAFPMLVMFIWAPQIFTWIFGSQWHTAGEFARWLLFWQMFMFCSLPAVLFARIIRIQGKLFLFEMVLLATRVLVLIVGGMYMLALHTVVLFSLVGGIMNIILIVIVGYALMRQDGVATWRNFKDSLIEGL